MKAEVAKFLETVAEENGLDAEVRDDYSGRGMYGDETHAIVTDDPMGLLCHAVNFVKEYANDVVEGELIIPELNGFRTDSMGRYSQVLY